MPTLHIVYGPQGAGKTTYAQKLAQTRPAVLFSIDAWMTTLFSDDLPKSMSLGWIMPRVARCEAQIWSAAQQCLRCGSDVVLARTVKQGSTYSFKVTAGMFDFMETEYQALSSEELEISKVVATEA